MSARENSALGWIAWCVGGITVAVLTGRLSAMVHANGSAPIGITSIGVGALLGAALGGLATRLPLANQRRLAVGTLALALVTVIAQHAWLYRDFRRQWQAARATSPHVALFRNESPWSPSEYFTREATPRRVALWCMDAALIMASAAATVRWMRRHTSDASASRPMPIDLNPEP